MEQHAVKMLCICFGILTPFCKTVLALLSQSQTVWGTLSSVPPVAGMKILFYFWLAQLEFCFCSLKHVHRIENIVIQKKQEWSLIRRRDKNVVIRHRAQSDKYTVNQSPLALQNATPQEVSLAIPEALPAFIPTCRFTHVWCSSVRWVGFSTVSKHFPQKLDSQLPFACLLCILCELMDLCVHSAGTNSD